MLLNLLGSALRFDSGDGRIHSFIAEYSHEVTKQRGKIPSFYDNYFQYFTMFFRFLDGCGKNTAIKFGSLCFEGNCWDVRLEVVRQFKSNKSCSTT